ncbi:MAG: methyltransferase domain-containing protein, partial [Candidatus Omnitrophica bacterium]|nr:methyltransferase domain-containing protein [Candidatus Omnitrophota bacterium]
MKLHQVLVLKDQESRGDGAWSYIRSQAAGSRLSDELTANERTAEKPDVILNMSLDREELAQLSPAAAVKALSILYSVVSLADDDSETAGDLLASLTVSTVLAGLLDVMWGGGVFTSLIASAISYFMAQLKPLGRLSLHMTDQGLKSKWKYFRAHAADNFVFSLNRALVHPDFRVRAVAYEISRSLSEAFAFSEFEHAFNINRDTLILSIRGNAPWIDPKEAYREEIFDGKPDPLRYVPVTDVYDPYDFDWTGVNASRLSKEDRSRPLLKYRTDPELLKADIEYFVDEKILPGFERYAFYRENPVMFREQIFQSLIANATRKEFPGRDVGFNDDDFNQQKILVELFRKKIREKIQAPGNESGFVELAIMELGVGSVPSEMVVMLNMIEQAAHAERFPLSDLTLTIVGVDGDSIHAKTMASYLDVRSYKWNQDRGFYSVITVVYEINALDQNGLNKARHDALLKGRKFDFIFARNIGPAYINRFTIKGLLNLSRYETMTAQQAADDLKDAVISWSILTNIAYTFSDANHTYLVTEPGDQFGEKGTADASDPQFTPVGFKSVTYNDLKPQNALSIREASRGNAYSGIALFTGADIDKQTLVEFVDALYGKPETGSRLSSAFNWEDRQVSEAYAAFTSNEFYRQVNEQLTKMAGPLSGETWVDLGSGTGSGTLLVAEAVGSDGRAIGVDASDQMVRWAEANSKSESAEFRQGSAEKISKLIPEDINGIIAFNSIHLMNDTDKVLSAAAEKLPDGGTFAFNTNFFSDPSVRSNDPNAVTMMEDIVGKVNRYAERESERPKRRRIKLKSPSDYRDLFEQNGFENILLQQEKIDIPIEALQSFYRVPGMASTLVPYEIPDDIAEEIVLSALEDLKKQGISSLSRTWLLVTAQKKSSGSRLASARAVDLYRADYNQIIAATAGLTELTESDIGRSRLILDESGEMRPFSELSEAYVPGATEVYMLPRSEVRRYLASVQEELADHPILGEKFHFVKPDNLHLTIQGLEQIPDGTGKLIAVPRAYPKEQEDVSGSYYQTIKEKAGKIITVQSRIQIGGLNWSPDIGLFWEVRPYVGDGETDLLSERRALWNIPSAKNPFHITAAYFKEPFSEEELNELRKFVSVHQSPLTSGYIQVDNAQIVLYDDFAFDSGYRPIHKTGFLGNFSRVDAVEDLRNLYQSIDNAFILKYQQILQAYQSGQGVSHVFNPARIKRMRDNFEQDADGNLIKDNQGAIPSKTDIYSTFISVGTNEPIKRAVETMNRRLIETLGESHDYYSVPGNTLHVSVFVAKEGRGEDKGEQPSFSDESRIAYLNSLNVIAQLISSYTLRLKEFKLSLEDGSI